MQYARARDDGLSLVELLIVIAIITVLAAISVPFIVRSGIFAGSRVELAARDLFTILRAAQVYAQTHNVDAAVVYVGTPTDPNGPDVVFETAVEPPVAVPVVDRVAIARRLTREELANFGLPLRDARFVFLSGRDGRFRELPNRTAILPSIFEVNGSQSETLLSSIVVLDPDTGQPISPRRIDPLDDSTIFSYRDPGFNWPAHVFDPAGGLKPDQFSTKQRVVLHVGLRPDQDPIDRFYQPFDDPNVTQFDTMDTFFHEPVEVPVFRDIDTGETIDVDVELELFVPTGRVRIDT